MIQWKKKLYLWACLKDILPAPDILIHVCYSLEYLMSCKYLILNWENSEMMNSWKMNDSWPKRDPDLWYWREVVSLKCDEIPKKEMWYFRVKESSVIIS